MLLLVEQHERLLVATVADEVGDAFSCAFEVLDGCDDGVDGGLPAHFNIHGEG